ncbi:beta-ketoacyl synthase N-terminal-like domain-containing protein, partial [Bacillus velezensis]
TGNRKRVYKFLGLSEETRTKTEVKRAALPSGKGRRAKMSGWNIKQCVIWELKDAISQILRISRDKLDVDENLADFGFDSISLAEFADVLSERYELEITPDIFFGYPTIERLSQYFLERYSDEMQAFYHESGKEVSLTTPPENRGQKIRKSRSKKLGIKQKQPGVEKDPIAIIGMSGRFPDARNVEELWSILYEGQEVICQVPYERVEWRAGNDTIEGNRSKKRTVGVVPGIAEFDPLFFELSPREAETMDPRQRLLLQESWKALEDAGYGSKSFGDEKVGFFVGVEDGDYSLMTGSKGGVTSNNNAVLAARLSYFLNLDGPNMAINTACSSGLVAVHQACQSLRNGECDTAIVAGANLLTTPEGYDSMDKAGMLSADGKCYAFDKRANGMVPA